MSRRQLAVDSVAVVIKGEFDPDTFSPKWLTELGVIGEQELSAAEYKWLLPSDSVNFTALWLRVFVKQDTVEISTDNADEFERVRDVCVGVLQSLPESPLSQMGLNRIVHFEVGNSGKWNAIGDNLAHNEIWDDVLDFVGMRSLVLWGSRPNLYSGRVQIQVEPSNIVKHGIYVSHNDHFGLTKIGSRPKSREEGQARTDLDDAKLSTDKIPAAIEILLDEWGPFIERSESVIERIAKQSGGS